MSSKHYDRQNWLNTYDKNTSSSPPAHTASHQESSQRTGIKNILQTWTCEALLWRKQ